MLLDRRQFTSASIASLAFAGAARLSASSGVATYRNEVAGYGLLMPDPKGLLDLPAGFRYSILSRAGEAMDDGFVTPDKFDGMACIALDSRRVALVRNHELKPEDRERGPTGGIARLDQRLAASPHFGRDSAGQVLPGGTTTMVIDLQELRRERQYLSLAGTAVNCAGGATPWGSWLSCEETTMSSPAVGQSHGWVFEVAGGGRGQARAMPLRDMGRFRHEAAAVDPRSGVVYLTEDEDDSLFYRFIPNAPGELGRGGRLQALALVDAAGADTRNWHARVLQPGQPVAVQWIDLDRVDNPADDLRMRGYHRGAALFARGEGIHFGDGELYFTCTSGGARRHGQIMRYVPSPHEGGQGEAARPGKLELFVESSDPSVMDYGDNLVVSPWGHLVVCEDRQDDKVNHLKGVTPEGKVYTFARLNAETELAGACFSPDGSTLFVNMYSPGRTFAITGPWTRLLPPRRTEAPGAPFGSPAD